MKYTNPVIPGFYPDPSACRVGNDYYLVTSSFIYFPGLPIFHSRDMVHWQQIGHCLTRSSQVDLNGLPSHRGIYAPTIRYHNNRFYVVTTNFMGTGNFLVHADDPQGPWSDPVFIDQPGIDPSLLFDDDKVYYTSNGSRDGKRVGIYQSRFDVETGQCLDAQSAFLWEGSGGRAAEAPHLYRIGNWYYLIVAEGGTEYTHMITVARSEAPDGPFTPCPHNPILTHASKENPIQCTGHGELIEDHHGQWWLLFLGVRPHGYQWAHHLGRETFLAPVEWDDAGWPIVNGGKPVQLEMQVEQAMQLQPAVTHTIRDDFNSDQLGMSWNFRRNPQSDNWSLTQSPGSLSLRCAKASLSDVASPAFVGRRHQHFDLRAETVVDFVPHDSNEEAGLAVIQNESHRVELAISRRNNQRVVMLRRTVGTLSAEVFVAAISEDSQVRLRLTAEKEWYHFAFAQHKSEQYTPVGDVETRHLSTEYAGGYSGTYIGMYATGNGKAGNNYAHFDWFDYERF